MTKRNRTASTKTRLIYRLALIRSLISNRLKRWLLPQPSHSFLFILSPPHCGSTLLTEILLLSKEVSGNNPVGTKEGQQLPELRKRMFHEKNRWDPSHEMDWHFIKKVWKKHWDVTKPVLLEKSPPNLVRALEIEKHFRPAYFIILVRNPYAHCESMMRRNGVSATEAARVAIDCLEHQQRNCHSLKRVLVLSYEDLTTNPVKTIKQIQAFLPNIGGINIKDKEFSAHNSLHRKMAIVNFNDQSINRLSAKDLAILNECFQSQRGLLEYWGYQLIR